MANLSPERPPSAFLIFDGCILVLYTKQNSVRRGFHCSKVKMLKIGSWVHLCQRVKSKTMESLRAVLEGESGHSDLEKYLEKEDIE